MKEEIMENISNGTALELEYIDYTQDISVNASGKVEEIISYHARLLVENSWLPDSVACDLCYRRDTQFIKILEAELIFQGQDYPISENKIEIIKPFLDDLNHDEVYKMRIPFESLHRDKSIKKELKFMLSTNL